MSLIDRTKEFFGLGPMDMDADDAYYADERAYSAPAYAPSYEKQEEEFVPTIVALSLVSFDDAATVSYTHLTLPTTRLVCRSRWSPCH